MFMDNDLRNLYKAIQEGTGFDYLSLGNGWNLPKDDMRRVLMELLYAIETSTVCDQYTHGCIIDEFTDNMDDYYNEYEEDDE